ncbi:winged helix-turn-helix domain-containing protein [Candidatus Halobonum tyrrellensis]|uniref:IclR-like transcriptional regulator n=1 Tax=Candidatus Halobonum tyrrellensis G22 TaxID=1324957 RepID=V4HPW3_9EURY|nr:helix-turn-helix domain-containing protein [Candidatus Halobonum tyrrellensis]ESP89954.1 IclR-like transcriptional regulator [Candidatus Halobonum tyrrellensis G22]
MTDHSPAVSTGRPERSPTPTDAESTDRLLDALDDDDCRAVLRAVGDRALSTSEIADACDLPLSTAYRKVDALTEAGLLDERTRVRRSGRHASEYVRAAEAVVASFDGADGLDLRLLGADGDDRFGDARAGGRAAPADD